MNELTPEEKRVILNKETEAPFTGEYDSLFEDGLFACRQCGLPLFDAKAKFDAHCGWPSFDASYPYAVKELLDADGERTEILCARCGGHLGHVFKGEQLTSANTRHCTNSLSIKFVPKSDQEAYLALPVNQLDIAEIVLGGGCFWCIEAAMLRIPGVVDSISGYAGGNTENPTYEEVCSGKTGHAEVTKISFDQRTISLEKILEFFFKVHDPTTKDRQGNDRGTQYRSVILYENEQDSVIIRSFIVKKQTEYSSPIVTEVLKLGVFYQAESYHQRYFEKNPYAGYCQMIVKPKVEKILTAIQ